MLDPAAVQNGDNGRNNLHGKFRQGIERQDIVKNAEHDDDRRTEQDAAQLTVDPGKAQHRDNEREEDGEAAHARDGDLVHAALVLRHIHRADALRQPLDERRDRKGQRRRHDERQQDLDNEIRIHNHVLLPGQRTTKPTFL